MSSIWFKNIQKTLNVENTLWRETSQEMFRREKYQSANIKPYQAIGFQKWRGTVVQRLEELRWKIERFPVVQTKQTETENNGRDEAFRT